jgi:hypothetical protein
LNNSLKHLQQLSIIISCLLVFFFAFMAFIAFVAFVAFMAFIAFIAIIGNAMAMILAKVTIAA